MLEVGVFIDPEIMIESKFGPLPEELVSQLEAVHDVDELTRLCKLALQAKTLDEFGFQEVENTVD